MQRLQEIEIRAGRDQILEPLRSDRLCIANGNGFFVDILGHFLLVTKATRLPPELDLVFSGRSPAPGRSARIFS